MFRFDDKSYQVSGGLHGVGVSVVNALSEWLKATVYKDGKAYFQEYRRGVPVADVRVISGGETVERSGTVIQFMPDPEIFETTEFKFDVLSSRLRELAYLNRGLRISIHDERDLSKVAFRLDMFESLARGYLEAARGFLSTAEIDCLAFSGKLITFEIGIRFLADYLSGDVYFKTHRPGHNLDRTRTQFEMVRQMEERAEGMSAIIDRLR